MEVFKNLCYILYRIGERRFAESSQFTLESIEFPRLRTPTLGILTDKIRD